MDRNVRNPVPKATLGRLPRYLRYLRELPAGERLYVSATAIARALSLGEVQVRKDLSAVSGEGKPRLGYLTETLIEDIESVLGYDSLTPAVLVGAGRLGRALLEFDEFENYGVRIAAAFDCNEHVIRLGRGVQILPMGEFESFCVGNGVRIGIITVGDGSAQSVCDRMIECGINAVWNFAPCKLSVPDSVLLKQENLALSLAYLKNQLCNQFQEEIK